MKQTARPEGEISKLQVGMAARGGPALPRRGPKRTAAVMLMEGDAEDAAAAQAKEDAEPEGGDERAPSEAALEEWHRGLHLKKTYTAQRRLSEGTWRPDDRLVLLTTNKGPAFQTMGFSRGGEEFYRVEEAVYLADQAVLRIYHHGVELSLSQAYGLLHEGGVPFDHYSVYAHLTRLGFILSRTRLHQDDLPEAAPRVAYDVWKAKKKGFKKSLMDTLQPDFRLCITRQSDPPPPHALLRDLIQRSTGVPVQFGIVDGGVITFASFQAPNF